MTRRINSERLQAATPGTTGASVDGYFDRIIKYIPSDVVGAWVAATGIIPAAASGAPPNKVLWIAFAFGVVFTALWVWRQTSTPGQPPAVTQIVISTSAFVVWVFALGGPFADLSWYQPYLGSLVLIAFTLSVGLVIPKDGSGR